MVRKTLLGGLLLVAATSLHSQVTLERCIELARENYPLIKKYALLDLTAEIDLSDINKSWLPQASVYGQATVQNVVPSFPDALSDMMARIGSEMPGLDKLQYKVGIDINQTIWDGGASKSRRRIARTDNVESQARLDVQLYAVRERVENLFFGILLIDQQIKQTLEMQTLLQSNLGRLRSMLANGTATQSDVDMVEAQYLASEQQLTQARATSRSYRRMLELFTGTGLHDRQLEKPVATMPADVSVNRPEMRLFEAQTRANEARSEAITSSLMPRIGLFAQAFYGYPGFDYFKSMSSRNLTFNLLAGIKLSWNIGSLYTKRNSERKLQIAAENIAADRDLFLFNTSLQTRRQTDRINELESIMENDVRILELRANVRRADESQLANGVIDATSLLTKITDENRARLTSAYHEIQLIQSIYQLKYTINR